MQTQSRNLPVGRVLTITGISQKGKSRVHEHGDMWVICEEQQPAACFDGKPAIRLMALSGYTRWVAVEGDRDFSWK